MNLELTAKEARILRELLEDHLHYGWVESHGEFGATATWEISPTLEKLYRRLIAQDTGSSGQKRAG